MPWAPSFLFLSFIRNEVSYVLIDQHLLNLECISQIVWTLPDRHQASVDIVDTDRLV
jgi:hypothetical protein